MNKKAMAIGLTQQLNMLMEASFRGENAELIICRDIFEGQRAFAEGWYCLLSVNISDWTPPEQGDAVTRLRNATIAPLLVLTAADNAPELLKAGADVCLPPGAPPDVAVSHALALIRRYTLYNHYGVTNPDAAILYRGELVIDPLRHRVTLGGDALRLQRREFRLLTYFAQNPGIVLSPEQICDTVWMTEHDYNRDVSGVIAELRHKLKDDPGSPTYIETVHGVGYRFLPHR